jgi:eukaryotic-like serine/threonine-protein kinase
MAHSEGPPDSGTAAGNIQPVAFGNYLLERRLAVGGTSQVFLARRRDGGAGNERLVIKRLLPSLLSDAQAVGTFATEARLHRAVRHPNVVEVFEAGMVGDEPYLAMEYVNGVDAARLVRRAQAEQRALPEQLAAYVARSLCDALESVHEARDAQGVALGILHRDVTPSNIYLSSAGDVRLGDFGIARERLKASRGAQNPALKGKYAYLSPEQVSGEPIDHRSDLFSCAVVCAELILGQPLFAGAGQLAVLLAIRDARIDSLRAAAPRISPGLFSVLARALSRDPAARFQTARALGTALSPFEGSSRAITAQLLRDWVAWTRNTGELARRIHGAIAGSSERLRGAAPAPGAGAPAGPGGPAGAPARSPQPPRAAPQASPPRPPPRPAAQAPAGQPATQAQAQRPQAPPPPEPRDELGSLGPFDDLGSPPSSRKPAPSLDSPFGLDAPAHEADGLFELDDLEHPADPAFELDTPEPVTARFDEVPSHVRVGNRQFANVAFARIIQMIVTGELGPEDEVDLMGQGFRRVTEIELLERHLPDIVTARAMQAPSPPDETIALGADGSLLTLLGKLSSEREAGMLLVEGHPSPGEPLARREIYVQGGLLLHVASADASDLLGQGLVRRGVITSSELDMALAVLSRFEGRLGDTLIGLGLVDAVDIFRAIEAQGRERLSRLFLWSSGSVAFYRGVRPSRVEFPLELELPPLMLAGLELSMPEDSPVARARELMGRTVRRAPRLPIAALRKSLPRPVGVLLDALGASGMELRHMLMRLSTSGMLSAADAIRALHVAIALGLLELR